MKKPGRPNVARLAPGRRGAPPGRHAGLMVDIEALPGEADEQVLQARGLDRKAAHPDARVHQLGADHAPVLRGPSSA